MGPRNLFTLNRCGPRSEEGLHTEPLFFVGLFFPRGFREGGKLNDLEVNCFLTRLLLFSLHFPLSLSQYIAPPKPINLTHYKLHHHNKTPPPTTSPTTSPTNAPTNTSPTPSPSASGRHVPEFLLVMSDEFNSPGRDFADGHDSTWTSLNKNDYTNNALHYYHPSNVYTKQGALTIKTEAREVGVVGFDDVERVKRREEKHFRSGMVQSWNKVREDSADNSFHLSPPSSPSPLLYR